MLINYLPSTLTFFLKSAEGLDGMCFETIRGPCHDIFRVIFFYKQASEHCTLLDEKQSDRADKLTHVACVTKLYQTKEITCRLEDDTTSVHSS